jgi:hypothetical protein
MIPVTGAGELVGERRQKELIALEGNEALISFYDLDRGFFAA